MNELRRIKGKVAAGRENLCDACDEKQVIKFWGDYGMPYYQLCEYHYEAYKDGEYEGAGEVEE